MWRRWRRPCSNPHRSVVYNEFYESIVGRRAALDPLDIINDTVGDFTGYQLPNTVQAAVSGKWDFTKEKPGTYQAIKNLEGNIISEFPGTQALTILGVDEALGLDIDSGRIAVTSAIPNLGNIEKALLAKNEDMAPAKKAQTHGNELLKPGPVSGDAVRRRAGSASRIRARRRRLAAAATQWTTRGAISYSYRV